MRITTKYITVLFTLSVVCVAVMWLLVASPAMQTINKQSAEIYDNLVDLAVDNYADLFDGVERMSYSFYGLGDLYAVLTQSNTQRYQTSYTAMLASLRMSIWHFLADPSVFSIALYNTGGDIVLSTHNTISDAYMAPWYDAAQQAGGRPVWSAVYPSDVFQSADPRLALRGIDVVSMFRMINDPNTFEQVGTLRVSLLEETLYSVIESTNSLRAGLVLYVVDGDGVVLSAGDKALLGTTLDLAADGMRLTPIGNRNLYVAAHYDAGFIGQPERTLIGYMTYAVALLLVFAFGYALLTSVYMVRPIKRLAHKMHEVELGNLDIQVETRRRDEVGMLTESFNNMTRSLRQMMDKLVSAGIRESELKVQTLRLQLNPHFLFNTLDNLRWMARRHGDPESEPYIESLSQMLRTSLNGRPIATVFEELRTAQNYMHLEQLRFGESLQYVVSVPDALLSYYMPSFIMQPILENSIMRGLKNRNGEGTVFVTVEQQGEDLVIDITDDGDGTDEVRVRAIIAGQSDEPGIHALNNIENRIRLYFGEAYHGGVAFYSKPGLGARVVVTVPADPARYTLLLNRNKEARVREEHPDR